LGNEISNQLGGLPCARAERAESFRPLEGVLMPDDPFDTTFMRKLEHLEIAFRRLRSGRGAGENVGKGRGGRTEFREHRRYTTGDDFRYIDWNVFGRSDSLFVKEYAREERRTVAVLLDASGSMSFGSPAKMLYAKQIAAAFAYLALAAGDEAVVAVFSDGIDKSITVAGQKSRITQVFRELRGVQPRARTKIETSLKEFYESIRTRSLVVLISDLMDSDCKASLAVLSARGFEPCVIQVLSRGEADPRQTGRLRLKDSETGETRQIWVEGAELQEYKLILNQFIEGWKTFCSKHGIDFATAFTDMPFDEFVLGRLRRGGVLR